VSDCRYVSSRGILQSCDVRSLQPQSSVTQLVDYDYSSLRDGCTFYVCGSAIPHFAANLSTIPCRIVLVTGDSDEDCPYNMFESSDDFFKFIDSDTIIHWFAQNCSAFYPKLTAIPIGLDYHTLSIEAKSWGPQASPAEQERELEAVRSGAAPFWEREVACYGNFQFTIGGRYAEDRADALRSVPPSIVHYEPEPTRRLNCWRTQANYAFVISPTGMGRDCHRTWEALCLGCIPVVRTSPMDVLFDGLPVLIVNKWSDLNRDLLEATIASFRNRVFDYDRLLLRYWTERLTRADAA
jgi:hypothetical protein